MTTVNEQEISLLPVPAKIKTNNCRICMEDDLNFMGGDIPTMVRHDWENHRFATLWSMNLKMYIIMWIICSILMLAALFISTSYFIFPFIVGLVGNIEVTYFYVRDVNIKTLIRNVSIARELFKQHPDEYQKYLAVLKQGYKVSLNEVNNFS